MPKGTMKLLDPSTGLMECRVCGSRHVANLRTGGYYFRGSWQCPYREDHPVEAETARVEAR